MDGKVIDLLYFGEEGAADICGNSYNDDTFNINYSFEHISDSIEIEFIA